MRLEGKTTMITGASRNIGRQIALTFAREGSDLILNTRSSKNELNEVASACAELGVKTHIILGDVSDPDKCSEMVQKRVNPAGHRASVEVPKIPVVAGGGGLTI